MPSFGKMRGASEIEYKPTEGFNLTSDQANAMIEGGPDADGAQPIEYQSTMFKYNLKPGSMSSINFHQALDDTEANSVFGSTSVQKILEYKWDRVKTFAHSLTIFYFLYLAWLYVAFAYLEMSEFGITILFVFGLIFAAFEILQISLNPIAYMQDRWNFLDLLRCLFIFSYCLMTYYGEFDAEIM